MNWLFHFEVLGIQAVVVDLTEDEARRMLVEEEGMVWKNADVIFKDRFYDHPIGIMAAECHGPTKPVFNIQGTQTGRFQAKHPNIPRRAC